MVFCKKKDFFKLPETKPSAVIAQLDPETLPNT